MYRMVVPLPPVEWGQKASPLGVRSHALGRKLSAKQTKEVPLRWLRAFIVAEARGVAFGEDLFRHGFAVPPSPSGEGLESENPRGLPGGGLVIQRLLIALDSFVGISPQRSCGAW